MSYIEIIKFKEDKTHELAGEVQNSSRHHCVIWNYFAKKYLGLEYFNVHSDCVEQQKLWDLFRDERLTINERIILGSTYDYVLVKKEDIPLVIDAFKSFEDESNLLEEAEILSSLLNDETCVAIGWQSTLTDLWDNYDIFTEKEHWSLLDEINAIQKVINDGKEVVIVDDGKEYEAIGKNAGGKIFKNIHDKEYFENVALKYLKAIPASTSYCEAKHNILKNMEKIEEYPLLKEILIHTNPIETIKIGLDSISSKVVQNYQITVADVLSQFIGGDTDA